MQYVKKWKKYIASLLAFAMLISNFTPSLPTIYAQSNDEEISSIELQQDEIQLNENQLEVITPDNNVEMELQPEDIQLDENQSEVTTSDNNSEMESEVDTSTLTIHYNRINNDYDGWSIHTWDTGIEGDTYEFTGEDEFGKIATLEVLTGNEVGYIIKKGDWEDKNHSDDQFVTVEEDMEIWVIQGQNGYYESKPNLDEVYPDD